MGKKPVPVAVDFSAHSFGFSAHLGVFLKTTITYKLLILVDIGPTLIQD